MNYEDLVREDEHGFFVSGRLYSDPAVFEDEMEKIFYRNWVFVGHESEIP
ncbi:MAG TPA: aromatic ring-hydroxylating dioxygenase subunit alpha, partial [Dehalococcoidia bacterium]|nr:aromatic ring-hydroxylating dioxygenase subunit alpha [Dehalococcoidia bacterium]